MGADLSSPSTLGHDASSGDGRLVFIPSFSPLFTDHKVLSQTTFRFRGLGVHPMGSFFVPYIEGVDTVQFNSGRFVPHSGFLPDASPLSIVAFSFVPVSYEG